MLQHPLFIEDQFSELRYFQTICLASVLNPDFPTGAEQGVAVINRLTDLLQFHEAIRLLPTAKLRL